jgi:hypothetical protein
MPVRQYNDTKSSQLIFIDPFLAKQLQLASKDNFQQMEADAADTSKYEICINSFRTR